MNQTRLSLQMMLWTVLLGLQSIGLPGLAYDNREFVENAPMQSFREGGNGTSRLAFLDGERWQGAVG